MPSALPLKGTMLQHSTLKANSSTARCGVVPLPVEPKVNFSRVGLGKINQVLDALIGESDRTTMPKV